MRPLIPVAKYWSLFQTMITKAAGEISLKEELCEKLIVIFLSIPLELENVIQQ